jgi:ABC-type multidrug transport system fused ATPase/permease subunit
VRKEELAHLRWNFYLEVAFQFIWTASPILCVLGEFFISSLERITDINDEDTVSFYVYTVTMGQELTPSVAFASLAVWNELRFALNIIPDLIVNAIQCLVSLRRIESYLALPEVDTSDPDEDESALAHNDMIALNCATITWPFLVSKEDNAHNGTLNASATPGGGQRFELQDLSVEFPVGQLTIVCGTIGSGKTLLLLCARSSLFLRFLRY